ncbi:MAG: hypothetical protein OEW67_07785 [Cyclobacteriaceae bacterium]|nr:hypothetical protein [Cyclobacteriaceae bacterium]
MKLSFKNIAITLGIATGALVAAVITSKNIKNPSTLIAKKSDTKEGNLKDSKIDNSEELEEDILYV